MSGEAESIRTSPMDTHAVAFNSAILSRAWYENPTATLVLGFTSLAAFAAQEQFVTPSIYERLGVVAAYAVAAVSDNLSTSRGFVVSDEAQQLGIKSGIVERNPTLNKASTLAEYKLANRQKKAVISEAVKYTLAIISPSIGFGMGVMRLTAATSNRRKTKRVLKAMDQVIS